MLPKGKDEEVESVWGEQKKLGGKKNEWRERGGGEC